MLTLSHDYVAIDCVGYRESGRSAERRLIVKVDRRWSDRTIERHLAEHARNKLIVRGGSRRDRLDHDDQVVPVGPLHI